MVTNKRVLTGIQPSGTLHLGNYFGTMRQSIAAQNDNECFYFIANFHAQTSMPKPEDLRARTHQVAVDFLACGLDPAKTVFWRQSDVPAVQTLAWILSCLCPLGLLERCHSYKDKVAHGLESNHGLLAYPVLMAADILLYMTNLVPIGADQKQHLELARDIAQRFNALYGDVFPVPEGYFPKVGARIMSLQDPTRKMSKSDPEECYIAILDKPDVIRKKLRHAVTASDTRVVFDPENKPGVPNLMSIMTALSGKTMDEVSAEYDGKGYGVFKDAVADCVISVLEPIQNEYDRISADKAYLEQVMVSGRERAARIAYKTMLKVRKKVGLAALTL